VDQTAPNRHAVAFRVAIVVALGALAMVAPAAGARIHWPQSHRQSQPSRHPVVLHTPQRTRISLLYVLTSAAGTLTTQHGQLTLTLTGVEPQLVWFSDRPARRAGSFPARGIVSSWEGFGFGRVPPNAALVYTDKRGNRDRTVILELSHPRVAGGGRVLRFAATVVDPRTVRSGDLASHARVADRRPASHLTDPSLFIDSVAGMSYNGCVIQPYGDCSGLGEALTGTDFTELDLQGIDFQGDNLSDSTFNGANLNGANLAGTTLNGASFNDVQASNAAFQDSSFYGATALNGNFTGSSFENADLNWSNFSGANLTKAHLGTWEENAILDNANLTHATVFSVNFNWAHLENTNFSDVLFWGVDLWGATLTGDNLSGASGCIYPLDAFGKRRGTFSCGAPGEGGEGL
jgi:uncharacterized protein YjbI with pentapeptide repeats